MCYVKSYKDRWQKGLLLRSRLRRSGLEREFTRLRSTLSKTHVLMFQQQKWYLKRSHKWCGGWQGSGASCSDRLRVCYSWWPAEIVTFLLEALEIFAASYFLVTAVVTPAATISLMSGTAKRPLMPLGGVCKFSLWLRTHLRITFHIRKTRGL